MRFSGCKQGLRIFTCIFLFFSGMAPVFCTLCTLKEFLINSSWFSIRFNHLFWCDIWWSLVFCMLLLFLVIYFYVVFN